MISKERQKRIEELRERIKLSFQKSQEKKAQEEISLLPRYDEVYWEGLRWLNGEDDIPSEPFYIDSEGSQMKSRDFCYWLQGLFEISNPSSLNEEQIKLIRHHLNLVFQHEIDPNLPNK